MKGIELEKAYNPKDFEDRIYAQWESNGYFLPKSDASSPIHSSEKLQSFVVVIPPPNVTGVLHMGHGLNNILQDIVVRYHRMKGENTLWMPGTDHAGIATQNVVERRLRAEGKSRQDLGREAFIQKAWEVKNEHHAIITKQLRKLGASVDWSRERFTLDEGLSKAVRDVFVTLYERGLIYRGNYLVNWCTSCGTALAEEEVEHEEKNSFMYYIFYEVEDGTTLEIATTRPETLLGDTAVAVHPDDERYKHLIGKTVKLPLTKKTIPIIADTYVEKEFGSGVVKITPAHDPNDWEVAKRHNLPVINILTPEGKLNDEVPEMYRGLKIDAARKAVLADLEKAGLYKEKKNIMHAVGQCYRCGTVIEPFLSKQWFVKMKPLAKKALEAWKKGEIVFYPKKWENTYAHWMENIRDWCISRQLWWGHRIPVWYCSCGEVIVSRSDPEQCPKCHAKKETLSQDADVLDTWFSSWIWPFSTLGWPEKTADLSTFYPTTALVTAYDIIFFWVSRMVMAGLEFTGEVPFKDIYLHGLVRDKQGKKMSKSLGNGIDPLKIIDEYGSDALKFTLSFSCAQGQDILVDKESFKLGSRFANKIWNAARYILLNLEGCTLLSIDESAQVKNGAQNGLTSLDRWIYARLNDCAEKTANALEHYRYNDGAQALYEFFWNDFCDWYVEITKISFKNGSQHEKNRTLSVLVKVLEESLRLLHPYLPFVTEEIYSKLPREILDHNCTSCYSGMLIAATYPQYKKERAYAKEAQQFATLQEVVRQIRTVRAECGIAPEQKLVCALHILPNSLAEICYESTQVLCLLAGLAKVDFVSEKPAKSIGTVGEGFEAFILTQQGIDSEQLAARFHKEISTESAFIAKLEAKLSGQFAKNAPENVVVLEREKLAIAKHRVEKLTSYLTGL